MRGSLARAFVVLALALGATGCPHQSPPPDAALVEADTGPGDPRFLDPITLDDTAVMAMDPSALPASPSACRAPLLARVTFITDGDTIHVEGVTEATGDLTIRMIGINAPEIAHGAGTTAECYGDEATTFTRQLDGHLLWLTFDGECFDVYGRTLAYLTYGPAEHQSWERQMLRRGFARTLSIAPNTTNAITYAEDARLAEHEGAGLWSACP
ncbi:MAG: thermonuclease family protein [Sandaracinus sp.]